MQKPSGLLGDTLGQLGGLGKGVGQSIISTPKDLTKTAASQIGIAALEEKEKADLGEQLTGGKKPTPEKKAGGFQDDKDRVDFLKDLYGINKQKENPEQQQAQQQKPPEQPKTPQEQEEIAETQRKLQALNQQHQDTYVKPTFERPPELEEERAAEKVEKEKEEDERKNLEVKKKKEQKPMDQMMAEQRVEKFRGAGG